MQLRIPDWLRYRKGINERSKVLFLDIRGTKLDLNSPRTIEKINDYLKKMHRELKLPLLSEPVLIKTHVGESKCITRMHPAFALSSLEFLREQGVERIVAGDSTVIYGGPRGYHENSYENVKRYLRLATKHGWNNKQLPFIVLDRPKSSLRGVFEFDREEVVKRVKINGAHNDFHIAGGFDAAGTVINHVHLTSHLLVPIALAVKGLAMGGASRWGKLKMHRCFLPRITKSKCTGCGTCEDICPQQAVALAENGIPKVEEDRCIGCGECEVHCPAGAITMKVERLEDWDKGKAGMSYRVVDYLFGVLQDKWDRLVNVAHLYNITKMCDCMNQRQKKIIANIGFLVGRNPFAVDWLAQELISEKIRADKAHFYYARDKFGIVVEPQILRVRWY